MKALTVQQPYAWAIVHGGKTVENRTQAWAYRGPLAIHAGARWSLSGGKANVVRQAMRPLLMKRQRGRGIDPAEHPERFPFGAIIGVVDLVDAHLALTCAAGDHGEMCSAWAESSYDEHGGRTRRDVVHLVLENPRPLPTPIPAKGRLGLWTPDPVVLAQLQEASP